MTRARIFLTELWELRKSRAPTHADRSSEPHRTEPHRTAPHRNMPIDKLLMASGVGTVRAKERAKRA